jgi:hypothetical protein
MSCCGGKRQQFHGTGTLRRATQITTRAGPIGTIPPSALSEPALFEYLGQTNLSLVGTNTGRRYRFDAPGARVSVDPRDAPALDGVPWLRRVITS